MKAFLMLCFIVSLLLLVLFAASIVLVVIAIVRGEDEFYKDESDE